jgi:hypothetical protein
MTDIVIMGETYEYETNIDQTKMTITDPATGEWSTWHDTDNLVGDPDFYEDWEDWILQNLDNLDWNEE